jgi:hypothetical protein
MGKIKSEFFDNKTQKEIEEELYNRYDDAAQYQEWIESDDFINFVNDELELSSPIYSKIDVNSALNYAMESMSVYPEEVGKDVYGKLIHEKVFEYLNNRYGF